MSKFIVDWSKTYYVSGTVEVEAANEDEAYSIVDDNIGDYTGSMQYDPNENYINVNTLMRIFEELANAEVIRADCYLTDNYTYSEIGANAGDWTCEIFYYGDNGTYEGYFTYDDFVNAVPYGAGWKITAKDGEKTILTFYTLCPQDGGR